MSTQRHQHEQKKKELIRQALVSVKSHPVFCYFSVYLTFDVHQKEPLLYNGLGTLTANPNANWDADTWTYAIAVCFTQLGLGLISKESRTLLPAEHATHFLLAARFVNGIRLCPIPERFQFQDTFPAKSTHELAEWLNIHKDISEYVTLLPYGDHGFFEAGDTHKFIQARMPPFEHWLQEGIQMAVKAALEVASGRMDSIGAYKTIQHTKGHDARMWLLLHYPLLSAIASYFELVEDIQTCQRLQVSVGMIDLTNKKVYLNPLAGLSPEETIWVLAHEYLHAGLNHGTRIEGRDPELWNAACDYVINLWLEELGIGVRPMIGVLYDIQFKGWSAERVYDALVERIRIGRKLKWETPAGMGKRDFIGYSEFGDTTAEEYCRQALIQGAALHQTQGTRGLLPAELEEAIRALSQPIIPWDVQLGNWFDLHVPYPEKKRTYTRQSRRQQAAPDTPLPRSFIAEEYKNNGHTFGVILDTSGSMDRSLLAKALGTIAHYALAHEVPAVRLVFCDAQPYDVGYVSPDDLLSQPVRVLGRGGTVLAPAVAHFDSMKDFPLNAPLLVLTDGETDSFQIKRTHAFVLPKGKRLPFPAADVFYIS